MFLNREAGRSFQDLTQYPVMPWVVADYASPTLDLDDPATFRDLSKPVGALSAKRLAGFRERFAELARMADASAAKLPGAPPPLEVPPFMYGCHYSAPGYVVFYLMRSAPQLMLRLQNGRFDAPDRLFGSLAEAWRSVTTLPTDVKELTPEFYCDPAFLVNGRRLDFGACSSGAALAPASLCRTGWRLNLRGGGNGRAPLRPVRLARACEAVVSGEWAPHRRPVHSGSKCLRPQKDPVGNVARPPPRAAAAADRVAQRAPVQRRRTPCCVLTSAFQCCALAHTCGRARAPRPRAPHVCRRAGRRRGAAAVGGRRGGLRRAAGGCAGGAARLRAPAPLDRPGLRLRQPRASRRARRQRVPLPHLRRHVRRHLPEPKPTLP